MRVKEWQAYRDVTAYAHGLTRYAASQPTRCVRHAAVVAVARFLSLAATSGASSTGGSECLKRFGEEAAIAVAEWLGGMAGSACCRIESGRLVSKIHTWLAGHVFGN